MSKKRHKFDLTHLIHTGTLKNGQLLIYVSDPRKFCRVAKQPNGEFKVLVGKETMTVHAFAQHCLGQDPPDHATKWFRTETGQTLYELWQSEYAEEAA
jgi:hypothetical protein